MPQVKLSIKGLVACYRKEVLEVKEDAWTFDFPVGGKHQVKCWIMRKDGSEDPLGNLAGKSVQIRVSNSIRPAAFEDEKFTKDVFDLTSDYLHKEGLANRQIKPHGISKFAITVPNATLTSISKRENRYNFVFLKHDILSIRLLTDDNGEPKIFSNEIGGSIDLEDRGTFAIVVDGIEKTLEDGDCLKFDNDCHQATVEENDFQYYQKIYQNLRTDDEYNFMSLPTDSQRSVTPKDKIKVEDLLDPQQFIIQFFRILSNTPPIFCDPIKIGKPGGLGD